MSQTLQQFGQTVKQKHPEYSDLPDDVVAQKVLAKYPQYQDMVKQPTGKEQRLALATGQQPSNFTPVPEASTADYAANNPMFKGGAIASAASSLSSSLDRQDQGQQGPVQTAIQAGYHTLIQPAFDTAGKIFQPVSQASDAILNQGAARVANAVTGKGFTPNPTPDPFSYIQDPGHRDTAESIFNTAQAALMLKGGAKVAPDVASSVERVPEALDQAATKKYSAQAQAEWAKPATTPKPAYSNAAEIYNNAKASGHDISQTLTRNKLSVSDYIGDNGNYDTSEAAAKMHQDANQLSTDMLRPALQQADLVTPRTSVIEMITEARQNILNNKSLTPETQLTLLKKLTNSEKVLSQKYPDGMSLEELHDQKILRDQNAKYDNVTNNPATNNEATNNKAIADAARVIVEKKGAQAGIPVDQFNQELAKQHQAANYLDALDKKKAPVSLGAKLRQGAGKVVGAKVGSMFGGGIMGGVAGYHIGGMIEGFLEGLPNPMKQYYLDKLRTANPEAFNTVSQYLKDAPATKQLLNQKALPPASTIFAPGGQQTQPNLGTHSYYDPMPDFQYQNNIKRLPAGTQAPTIFAGPGPDPSSSTVFTPSTAVARDPKTGRMFKVYQSTPKH